MQIIVPAEITLLSSSVPETDHPAWVSGSTYAVGDRRIRTSTHSIYERLTAGAGTTPPESDAANWKRVGPTNRWAMLDGAVGSNTTASGSLAVTFTAGIVRALALLDVDADTVAVTLTSGGATVYSRTVNLASVRQTVDNWWDWSFAGFLRRRVLILTDLPPYAGEITVALTGAAVSVGTLVAGPLYQVGETRYGVNLGGINYGKSATDDFGVTAFVKRTKAKKLTLPLQLPAGAVDIAARRLNDLYDAPAVWIGSDLYESMVVYGYMTSWSIDVPYPTVSMGSVSINGLT